MDQKEIRQYEKMILTPPKRLIITLAVPTILSMLITMIYNLVDAYFVGILGTSAAAAVGVVMSIQAVFQAFGFMFGHGAGTLISRALSEGRREEADKTLTTSFLSSLLVAGILSAFGLIFLTPLSIGLGSTKTILPYSEIYGMYILLAGPGFAASCVLNNVMRYEGKASLAMIGLVSGGVLNMIGDPILMFGLKLHIHGAGLSTAISQYISLFLLLIMFLTGRTMSRIRPGLLFRDPVKQIALRFLHIIRNGFPSLMRQAMNSLSNIVLNNASKPYGDAAIAAMTIAGRMLAFIMAVAMGIGQGFQPVSAFNYGAAKYRRFREAFRFALILGTLVMAVLGSIVFIFPGPVIGLFRDDKDVIDYGATALRCMCIGAVFIPLGTLFNMMFQSIGKSGIATLAAMMRSGLFYIPLILILPLFLGYFGIQSAQMWADILTAISSIPFLIHFFRKLPKEDQETEMDRTYLNAIAPRP
ncbi:MAG: MATE family efflux transporter [Lachnospiraceae bacterium]|nr:MATE family efflux transporter [Lachnospiraceae bacterium]